MRLGWITSNVDFHQLLISYIDYSTSQPAGLSQMLVTELLSPQGWQLAGFDRWVRSLRAEYQRRRDFFLALFAREVDPVHLTTPPPAGGMFVWARVNLERHPRYRCDLHRDDPKAFTKTNTDALMRELFERCMDADLVVMTGSLFATRAEPHFLDREDLLDDVSRFFIAGYRAALLLRILLP